MKVKVIDGQNLLDIAVQTAGSVEAAFNLALKSSLSVTDDVAAGDELATIDIVDKQIKSYYDNRNIKPATQQTDGIDYTGIEYDFIIE